MDGNYLLCDTKGEGSRSLAKVMAFTLPCDQRLYRDYFGKQMLLTDKLCHTNRRKEYGKEQVIDTL